MAGGVFISYRRSDSAAFAGRIADFFTYCYPDVSVFFDVVAIELGEDFVEAIRRRLEGSEVILALIGETWLEATDAHGRRRLRNPSDFVRLELSMALAMDKRVIPVLLDRAEMPREHDLPDDLKPLTRCNAEFIRSAAFQRDAEHLAEFVSQYLGRSEVHAHIAEPPPGLPGSSVKQALVEAFETYRDRNNPAEYMICTDDEDRFVQFVHIGPGQVMLDLPTQALGPEQRVAAQRLLAEDYEAGRADLGGGDFAWQLDLPLEPAFLSHITLDIFEYVYGAPPSAPLSIEIDQ